MIAAVSIVDNVSLQFHQYFVLSLMNKEFIIFIHKVAMKKEFVFTNSTTIQAGNIIMEVFAEDVTCLTEVD